MVRWKLLTTKLNTLRNPPLVMIHFHIPLHASPNGIFDDTRDHITDTLKVLAADPEICQHIEMETYTWEVLPKSMQSNNVVEQLSLEYEWTLNSLRDVGLF